MIVLSIHRKPVQKALLPYFDPQDIACPVLCFTSVKRVRILQGTAVSSCPFPVHILEGKAALKLLQKRNRFLCPLLWISQQLLSSLGLCPIRSCRFRLHDYLGFGSPTAGQSQPDPCQDPHIYDPFSHSDHHPAFILTSARNPHKCPQKN